MIEELLMYSLAGIFIYSVVAMNMYKEEVKEKDKQIRFKDAQIEDLRHNLNLTMKKYQEELKENK